jgi:hypothetical protein
MEATTTADDLVLWLVETFAVRELSVRGDDTEGVVIEATIDPADVRVGERRSRA